MHTIIDDLHTHDAGEQRRNPRTRRSDPVFWRDIGEIEYEMGWTLESSDDGLAFAWRGIDPPQRGTIIEIHRHGQELTDAPERALVRRIHVAHDDLAIIAAQVIPTTQGLYKDLCDAVLASHLHKPESVTV